MSTGPDGQGIEAGSRNRTLVVYQSLRQAIINGEYEAGDVLSQIQLAKHYGVSRGPIREALRLLQQEGLIDAEVNRRPRVAGVSPADIEGIYAQRITLESLAVSVSVPRFSSGDLEQLAEMLERMEELRGDDVEQWIAIHLEFHRFLVSHAGTRLCESIEYLLQHSERYRRIYTQDPGMWAPANIEHREIVDACRNRDAAAAGVLIGLHLSRNAATLLMVIAPDHEPTLIRAASRQVLGTHNVSDAGRHVGGGRPGAAAVGQSSSRTA